MILVSGASSGLGYAHGKVFLAQTGHMFTAGAGPIKNEREKTVPRGRLKEVFLDVNDIPGNPPPAGRITERRGQT